MKKLILLALTAVIMVGCEDYAPSTGKVNEFLIIVVDSCEYIKKSAPCHGFLAHKGNCRFCAERRKQELQNLVEQLKEKQLWQQLDTKNR